MLHNQIIAAIRTGAAVAGTAIIAALINWLASVGVTIELDSSWALALAGLLFAIGVAVYNLVGGWLAERWPAVGTLLFLVNKAPEYAEGEEGYEDQPYVKE